MDPTESDRAAIPGLDASTHLDYREWALEALGDDRQVYARSTTSEQRELVFLAALSAVGQSENVLNAEQRPFSRPARVV
jgi:hypothetical protein